MANFKVWAENSDNLADITTQKSEQTDGVLRVEEGLIQGDSVKSDEINSILRQNSLMTAALAEAFLNVDDIKYTTNKDELVELLKQRIASGIIEGEGDPDISEAPLNQKYKNILTNEIWEYTNIGWKKIVELKLKTIITTESRFILLPESSYPLHVILFGGGGAGTTGATKNGAWDDVQYGGGGGGGQFAFKNLSFTPAKLVVTIGQGGKNAASGYNGGTSSCLFYKTLSDFDFFDSLTALGGTCSCDWNGGSGGSGGGGGGGTGNDGSGDTSSSGTGGRGYQFGGGGAGSASRNWHAQGGNGGLYGGGGGNSAVKTSANDNDRLLSAGKGGLYGGDGGTTSYGAALPGADGTLLTPEILQNIFQFTDPYYFSLISASDMQGKGGSVDLSVEYPGGGGGGGLGGNGGSGEGGGGGGGGGLGGNGGSSEEYKSIYQRQGGGGGGGGYFASGGNGRNLCGGGGGGYGIFGEGGSYGSNTNGGIAAGGSGGGRDDTTLSTHNGGDGICIIYYYELENCEVQ